MPEVPPVSALLAGLAARGFALSERDGRVIVAPASKLAPEDVERIRGEREGLLAELRRLGAEASAWLAPYRQQTEGLPEGKWRDGLLALVDDGAAILAQRLASGVAAAWQAWWADWWGGALDLASRCGGRDWRFAVRRISERLAEEYADDV